MYDALFQPINIGTMEVRNRLVIPAMGSNLADDECNVSPRMVDYYGERARGGFGLITIEVTAVSPEGRAIPREPGLWADEHIEGYAKLADAIHAAGGKMAVQLHHAGRQTIPAFNGELPIVSCSPLPCPYCQVVPHEMTTEESYEMIEKFIDAAERAYKAGADAVEIHGAHGYLISQYMSMYSNRRVDEFGGSFDNRMRFPRLIVEGIRRRLGNDYPIIFRISGDEKTVGGREILETRAIAKAMLRAGVDAFNVASGAYGSLNWVWGAHDSQPGYMAQFAEEVKKSVDVPVIAVGRINEPEFANELVDSGRVDMVAIGRQSLADAHFANKALAGDTNDIAPCIGCHEGCTGEMLKGNCITCLVNPLSGREHEWKITPAEKTKKVLVAGGGPAGLQTAWILAKRGHEVCLYEQQDVLGGNMRVAANPPGKGDFARMIRYYADLCEQNGVTIHLNTAVDEAIIKDENPDTVILATGGVPLLPGIKGIDNPNFVSALDLLVGKASVGNNVLIAGGGMVAAETADYLGEYGRDVTIVEMCDEVCVGVNEMVKITLMRRLEAYDTTFVTGAEIIEFVDDGVVCQQCDDSVELQGYDSVVLALGIKSYNPLEEVAKKHCDDVHVLGDAAESGKALNATVSATEIALTI